MANAGHALRCWRAALATLVPWLFWLGAAIAALMTLRKGFAPALPVIIAAALPAGWWWAQGDVIPLASLLLVTLMAVILRERMRWGDSDCGGRRCHGSTRHLQSARWH
ncbi:hypothetical protein HORIV_45770 [Vreelandella olivaria]|uniref:Uncharacterized protein n=1 Tax=Vreelandella olivaria TaxID=390919 RepID=A0ABM7GND9_9GAMM|nr:hypothetical protein HORIV_45770 [Halomonas olivaria]